MTDMFGTLKILKHNVIVKKYCLQILKVKNIGFFLVYAASLISV